MFRMAYMRIVVNGPCKIWNYLTDDTATKVVKRGYFEAFRENLTVGDWIFVTTSTGGVILHVDEIDPLELGPSRWA